MDELKKLDYELKRMEAEKGGTLDINFGRYNNEFMDKVARYNTLLKKQRAEKSERDMYTDTEKALEEKESWTKL